MEFLKGRIRRNEKFELLPDADNPFMKSKPQEVLNRVTAIDILKEILDSKPSAIRHPMDAVPSTKASVRTLD